MAKERSEEEERRRAALKHNRNVQRGSMSRKDMFAALVKLSEELEATKESWNNLAWLTTERAKAWATKVNL